MSDHDTPAVPVPPGHAQAPVPPQPPVPPQTPAALHAPAPSAQNYPGAVAQTHPGAVANVPVAPAAPAQPTQVPGGYPAPAYPNTAYQTAAYPASAPVGYGAPAYAPRPNSGLAITSLICGIAGLVLGAFLLPLLASLVAVITGHMSLNQIKRNPALGGKGMGITGLVLGYIGLAFLILVVAIVLFSMLFIGSVGFLPFFLAS